MNIRLLTIRRLTNWSGRRRGLPVAALTLLLGGVGALVWQPRGAAQGAQGTLGTLAGGGFSSNVPASQAPMEQPTGVALDPLGRGFFVIDKVGDTSQLRFVNTSGGPVTLAGVTIQPNAINLIAGGGTRPLPGPARAVSLDLVTGLAVAPGGATVYLASSAGAILNVNLNAQTVSSLKTIETGDIRSLALNSAGEIHFISNRTVYKLNPDLNASDIIVAGSPNPQGQSNGDGGPAPAARLTNPMGIAFDRADNLLIAEGGDSRGNPPGAVRKVENGNISTLAEGGDLLFPTGITVAPDGNAYVAAGNSQRIIQVGTFGSILPVAGNNSGQACKIGENPTCGDGGSATNALLNLPGSTDLTTITLAADARGVFVPDFRYKKVRFVNLGGGEVTVAGTAIGPRNINSVAGSGLLRPYDNTPATFAELTTPSGVAADAQGNLFIADTGAGRLRFVNRGSGAITLFGGTPSSITIQPGQIATLNFGLGSVIIPPPPPDGLSGAVNIENQAEEGASFDIKDATFFTIQGLAATPNGVFIVDSLGGGVVRAPLSATGPRSGIVRFLNTSDSPVTVLGLQVDPGKIRHVAGTRNIQTQGGISDGAPALGSVIFPADVAVAGGVTLYVTDRNPDPNQNSGFIRRIDPAGRIANLVGGLNRPAGVAVDQEGRVLVADTHNNRVLRQASAGSGSFQPLATGLVRPRDVTVDSTGRVFATNAGTHQIVEITSGAPSVVAGTGAAGFNGDGLPATQSAIDLPTPPDNAAPSVTANITTLPNGDLIFTDTNNDRVRVLFRGGGGSPLASVSAASFTGATLAPESITSGFGTGLATSDQTATTQPLPTELGGTTIKVKDSAGTERDAPLFFVSGAQVNYLIPAGTAQGQATITVRAGNGNTSSGTANIEAVSPGIFAANSNGQGVAAAVVLRVKPNGEQITERVARPEGSAFVPVPINLTPGDQVFLILFGTGFRFNSGLPGISVTIGGTQGQVAFVGPTPGFAGLDQMNVFIPQDTARGLVNVVVRVDGKTANTVQVQLQ